MASSPDAAATVQATKKPADLPATDRDSPFYVPPLIHFLGGLVHRHRRFWKWLGRCESGLLGQKLQEVLVRAPVYVSGLARSGSTLLHEVVSSHPSVATHRIKDYPLVFTPYWWRRATAKSRAHEPHERPHKDGMMITIESPDAIEEMVWMAFFPNCHDPSVSNLLGAGEQHPEFAAFYQAHIRKLLLAEGATRYAAKDNYHVMRLPYLIRLFPDAKFLLPVRSPLGHIGSLVRQHEWFSKGHKENPRSLTVMQRSGHFEFGLDRRPMNLGDSNRVAAIQKAWAQGDEVRGLAIYWDMVYRYVHQLLESDPLVKAATMVVRFETVCDAPADTLRAVLNHCGLPDPEPIVRKHAPGIRFPTYYKSGFSAEQQEVIKKETSETARLFGYE